MMLLRRGDHRMRAIPKYILTLLIVLSVSVTYANPYDNPYNPIQNVQSFSALEVAKDKAVDYVGEADVASKVKGLNYTDLTGPSKVAAAQLGAFDIVKGVGNSKFGAGQLVTNIDALGMLIRMYGNDQDIRNRVTAANPGVVGTRFNQAMQDAYFNEARVLGIIDANESINYNKPATRETLGVWLVKAAKLEAPFQEKALYDAKDWKSIKIENLGAIETLVDLDIMTVQKDGRFNPSGTMNRRDWAQVLFKVFDEFTEALSLETHYGVVIGNLQSNDPTGTMQDLYIREVDDTIKRIQLKKPLRGKATGLLVFKDKIRDQSALSIGDEIRYILKDNVVRYVEVLPKGQVRSRLLEQLKTITDAVKYQGVVVSVTPETIKYNGLSQRNMRVRIENDDDKMVDLVSGRDFNLNLQNDYLLVKGTGFIEPSSLKKGDQLTYYVKDDKVLYATWGKVNAQAVSGTLRLISVLQDPPQVAMFDRTGNLKIFPVAKGAKVSVNFYSATLADLKPGASATMNILNGEIISILSDSYQPIPGYIPQEGKLRMATVLKVGASKISLKEDQKIYEIGPNTAIYRNTQLVPFSTLKAGDQVKLYFDNIYSNMPVRVVVAGKDQFITKILKGTVYGYNPNTLQVTISDRYKLQNTVWQSEIEPFAQSYTLASDAMISDKGNPISLEQLGSSSNRRPAYFVIRERLGKPEIAQLIFSGGGERSYKEAVKSFSTVIGRLVLKDNRTIAFGKDTLFIQNQRLVDESALAVNGTVQVITNVENNQEVAKVVRLMTTSDTLFDRVYIGAIDEVFSYSLNLNNWSKVSNYQWTKADQGSKLLQMTDDTTIYNATLKKNITRDNLFNGPYSRFENDSVNGIGLPKDGYYGYFVSDGKDMLQAMAIRFKELFAFDPIDDALTSNTQVSGKMDALLKATTFTMGTVGELDSKWKRVSLIDSQNYLSFHSEWVLNPTLTQVEMSDALIIKNDRTIGFEDLQIDDVLYLVRNDEDAMVVFVGP